MLHLLEKELRELGLTEVDHGGIGALATFVTGQHVDDHFGVADGTSDLDLAEANSYRDRGMNLAER